MKPPEQFESRICKNPITEHQHQCVLFEWAAWKANCGHPELRLMFAVANGGERNIIVAANLKAEGIKKGVPDIMLPVVRKPWNGLFIELKRPKSKGKAEGTASAEQLKWIATLQEQGYGACVCVGWEQARDTIVQYLNFRENVNA
jgi:hypothetical protein